LELEFDHYAEVAAASSNCPEEIFVLIRSGSHPAAVGEQHLNRKQVVDGESPLPA
jgi:hypothetical protein